MQYTPLISVVIPAYNGESLIGEALVSAQAQTYKHLEIIVADDGSTDGTLRFVQRMAAADPRIRVISQPHGGTQSARNAALKHAQGEWIALLDQDDVWLPEKLECQLLLLNDHPRPGLVYCNYYDWDGVHDLRLRYSKREKMVEGDVAKRLTSDCLFEASSVLVERKLAAAAGGFDPALHFAGDWDLWLRLAEAGLWVRGVWKPLMRYRLWGGNESKQRVPLAQQALAVVEKALARPQTPALKRCYQRSRNLARSNLELAQARQFLDTASDQVSPAVWRAWWRYPRRIKWLLRWGLLGWPKSLGGTAATAYVHRKLRARIQ